MRYTISFILSLFLFTLASADVIKQGSFQATSDGSNIVLHWFSVDETNVARFEVERRQGVQGEFLNIGTMDVKGPSLYEFVDYSAFQKVTAIFQYRIKIVFTNGSNPLYVGPVTVSHMVSGVRKTWGSIKAMFR